MTLNVRLVRDVTAEELQRIMEDNLTSIAGADFELWETLPRLGERCLIVESPQKELLVISFDARDATRALLEGLNSMEQLNHDLAGLFLVDYVKPSRLIVLAPETPPGARTLQDSGLLESKTFRVIEVNGERALLVEDDRAERSASLKATPIGLEPKPSDDATVEPLSSEEDRFFKQIS